MNIFYTLVVKSNNWPRRLKIVKKIVRNIFKLKKILEFDNKTKYYCNIVLTNDYYIKKLNKSFRKINKSTDVLTFLYKVKKNSEIENHCDIIISAETTNKDAKINNIDFYENFAHLIIHSILHINGYSHSNNKNY